MGLTLIRKSEGAPQKKNPRIALVLAGGAVSGGAFKVGGLKALNDFLVERKVTDMDMFVGLSADDYAQLAVSLDRREQIDAHLSLGTSRSVAAGRIAYVLKLRGPTLQVDTSCSSSLVAVHLAC